MDEPGTKARRGRGSDARASGQGRGAWVVGLGALVGLLVFVYRPLLDWVLADGSNWWPSVFSEDMPSQAAGRSVALHGVLAPVLVLWATHVEDRTWRGILVAPIYFSMASLGQGLVLLRPPASATLAVALLAGVALLAPVLAIAAVRSPVGPRAAPELPDTVTGGGDGGRGGAPAPSREEP